MASRNTIRGQSSDFVRMMIEKAQNKETPASPDAPQLDPHKIEDIVRNLKDKTMPKSKPFEPRRKI